LYSFSARADAGYSKVFRQCLELHGNFEVDIASSIEAGREKIKTKTYEAIVSDCALPRKESLELAKELRERSSSIKLYPNNNQRAEKL